VTQRRVLVTGATGLVGRALVASLLDDGRAVRILTRGSRALPPAWAGRVEVCHGDLIRPDTLAAAVDGCGSLYHLAGELRDEARVQAVNADGTRHLLDAARQADLSHVVHMSSVGVMGIDRPGPVDEHTEGTPHTAYERSKREGERLAQAWGAATGVPVAVLRPTIVFGVRDGDGPDSFLALLRAIASGRFLFVGRNAVANYVYVDDVVAAARAAAARGASGTLIVADPAPLTGFVAAAAEALGVPPPRRVLPRPLASVIAVGLEALGAIAGRPVPLTRARVRALSTRTAFRSARIDAVLGWRPAVGYREGLRRTVDGYRRAGQLPPS
jgi:nucleoside-diphosphate-sugar epimerase